MILFRNTPLLEPFPGLLKRLQIRAQIYSDQTDGKWVFVCKCLHDTVCDVSPRTILLVTASSTPLSQSGPAPRILSGPGNIQPKLRDVCRLFLALFSDSSCSLFGLVQFLRTLSWVLALPSSAAYLYPDWIRFQWAPWIRKIYKKFLL
jgi:hypothetical protein